jgi:thiamine phosphate synthase YjbQ (UPF0047 family)
MQKSCNTERITILDTADYIEHVVHQHETKQGLCSVSIPPFISKGCEVTRKITESITI